MKVKQFMFLLFSVIIGVGVLLAGCAPPAPGTPPTTPEGGVQSFYSWYLDYIGDRASGEGRNPLVDGAYRSSGHLTVEFVEEVDGILAPRGRGADGCGAPPGIC